KLGSFGPLLPTPSRSTLCDMAPILTRGLPSRWPRCRRDGDPRWEAQGLVTVCGRDGPPWSVIRSSLRALRSVGPLRLAALRAAARHDAGQAGEHLTELGGDGLLLAGGGPDLGRGGR